MKNCRNCRYCNVNEHDGECRRRPPRMRGEMLDNNDGTFSERQYAIWPVVNLDSDWCGEFMENTDIVGAF